MHEGDSDNAIGNVDLWRELVDQSESIKMAISNADL